MIWGLNCLGKQIQLRARGGARTWLEKILLGVLSRKVHIGTFQNREDDFEVPNMFFCPVEALSEVAKLCGSTTHRPWPGFGGSSHRGPRPLRGGDSWKLRGVEAASARQNRSFLLRLSSSSLESISPLSDPTHTAEPGSGSRPLSSCIPMFFSLGLLSPPPHSSGISGCWIPGVQVSGKVRYKP